MNYASPQNTEACQCRGQTGLRDNDRWANWLDPFIDTFTPTSVRNQIFPLQAPPVEILDCTTTTPPSRQSTHANQKDRRDAELSLESAHLQRQLATIETHHTPVPNPTTTRYILNDLTTVSIRTAQNTE